MLAAWTGRFYPDTFWAYHAMSAPVQVTGEFWGYYDTIRTSMPQNCSQDFQRIAEHLDDTFIEGDSTKVTQLKAMFGAEELRDTDFAA